MAIVFAAILAILYSYEIFAAIANDAAVNRLHLFGLACALGLLIVESLPTRNTKDR